MVIQDLPISSITCEKDLQCRVKIDAEVVDDYAAAMSSGAVFPPVVTFANGDGHNYLADGFHRVPAAQRAGKDTIRCEVHPGGKTAALLHACAANDGHGLRRSNADKRRTVELFLADPERAKFSDREIGKRCNVGNHMVADVRSRIGNVDTKRLCGDGRVIDTAGISNPNRWSRRNRLVLDKMLQRIGQMRMVASRAKNLDLSSQIAILDILTEQLSELASSL